ncbi:MAG: sulfurtransferase complex subunit TusB [Hyphomicrobiaceae bacterium]|nr:sulfurtransferase complex subunit TusB [Hyphomicrobiaceae bacterium]MCC0007182.1 sulfurtransferase complex subunit TusB [Hyphomicrobiaceae bacterium]
MTTLHMVNKSPFERNAMKSCLAHALEGDGVILFEDGVYGAVKGSAVTGDIQGKAGAVKVYVLGPDLAARGIADGRLIEGIKVVDYPGFVDLVTSHERTQSWL